MPYTGTKDSPSSETSTLIDVDIPKGDLEASKSFIIANTLGTEIKLITQRSWLISLQMLCQLGSPVIAMIFVGQLPDSAIYISGVGLARTFVNVTGTAMAWGFTTALFTLLPQSIGAGHIEHAAIYIQRSFYVCTVVSALLSITQIWAGDIMSAIGQPAELRDIVNTYSRWFIPYIFLTAFAAILTRLGQALDLNVWLTYCCVAMIASTPLFTYIFMFTLDFGYIGAAMAQNVAMLIYCITQFLLLVYKGYGYMFIPKPLSIVCTRKGIMQYINLALPGLAQSSFQWIIEEMAVLLAGYVANPTIALSTSVILANVFLVVIPFPIGVCNATNIRIGKYIGCGDVFKAKRAAKVGLMVAFSLLAMWCLILVAGRHGIPRIYTDNVQTIELTSNVMLIMTVYSSGCFVMMCVGGIYRGLGFQKIAAIVTFMSYWIIAWPWTMILLFGFEFRQDLLYGVATIWCGLSLGNVLASIGTIIYLVWKIDWYEAVKQSQGRVKRTMKDYQATKSFIRDDDNVRIQS